MSNWDKMIYPHWENFKSQIGLVDPYRMQYPKKKIYSYVAQAGKSRGDRVYVSEDHVKKHNKYE